MSLYFDRKMLKKEQNKKNIHQIKGGFDEKPR